MYSALQGGCIVPHTSEYLQLLDGTRLIQKEHLTGEENTFLFWKRDTWPCCSRMLWDQHSKPLWGSCSWSQRYHRTTISLKEPTQRIIILSSATYYMLPKKKKKKSKLWRKLDSIEQSPQPYAGTQTDPVLGIWFCIWAWWAPNAKTNN